MLRTFLVLVFICNFSFTALSQNGTGYPFANNNSQLRKVKEEEKKAQEAEYRKAQTMHGVAMLPNNEEILSGKHRQQIELKRIQRERQIQEMLYDDKVEYKIPDYRSPKFTEGYKVYLDAFKELSEMLSGLRNADIKRAVFITENAFYGNQESYQTFCNDINKIVEICRLKANNMQLNYGDKYARAAVLKSFFSDTIKVYSTDKLLYKHYPYNYDFLDYTAEKDWTNMFVSKLIKTNSGQCHSLPLLFRILAQEMNVEAYLSYAPKHTYIQIKDASGNMYNFETTHGGFGSNSWLMSSGYIKVNAIKSGIYMDTLSLKETIAHCMVDLAMGYKEKYGVDDFVLSCSDLALNYHRNNIYAICLMSDILTVYFKKELALSGNPSLAQMNDYPKLKTVYDLMLDHYNQIDGLGYEEMPPEMYEDWLKSLEEEKNRIESKKLSNQFITSKKK